MYYKIAQSYEKKLIYTKIFHIFYILLFEVNIL